MDNILEIENQNQTVAGGGSWQADDENQKIEDDAISHSNENSLNERDNGNFTELENIIYDAEAGSTITLEKDYVADGYMYNGISVSKSLTIDGNNHVLDAEYGSRIFKISADNVIIKNIIFKNGYGFREDGGAVFNSGTNCSIISCNFINCYAHNHEGEAIYNYGFNCSIISCNFTNNDGRYSDVGVIYNMAYYFNIISCNFINFFSTDYRGVIYDRGGNSVISSCNFTNCSSNDCGGAICIKHNSKFTISSCIFTNCSSENYAGAVYISSSNCFISSCEFIKCRTTNRGGAIYIDDDADVLINCSSFTDCYDCMTFGNTADGAVSKVHDSNLSVENCTYEDGENLNNTNTFFALQKIILDADEGSAVTLQKDYVYANGFDKCGISISKPLTIDGNDHILDAGSKGVIFNLNSNNVVIKNIIFVEGHGGAVSNYNGVNCSIISCDFINCSSDDDGGAIYNSIYHYEGKANFSIIDCNFINCSATSRGGAIYNSIYASEQDNAKFSIIDCNFINCSARSRGGAICNKESKNCSITSCNFTNCSGGTDAGVIYSYYFDDFNITSCIFTDCLTGGNGGCIYTYYGANMQISSCDFISSYAKYGGAVYNYCVTDCIIRSCRFSKNSANNFGGDIFNRGGNGSICSSVFANSFATSGGAISNYEGSIYDIDSCNFIDCYSLSFGSAVYSYESGSGTVVSCNFNNCSSYYGGAICNYNGGDYDMDSCNFIDCSAVGRGGAFYGYMGGKCHAVSCNFTNCAADNGGAICNYDGGDCEIDSCNFIDCCVTTDGGAFYNYGSGSGTICSCNFIDCSAADKGGVVYGCRSGNFSVNSCNFTKCAADNGGAAYTDDGDCFSAVLCSFVNCSAANMGGAMYHGNAVNCTFINNSASNGEAMFFCTAIFCIFENNDCGGTKFFPVINVRDFTSKYGSGEKLLFNVTYENQVFDEFNTAIDVYQNGNLVGTYYCISGDGWVVDLASGTYKAILSLVEYPETKSADVSIVVLPEKTESAILASPLTTAYNSGEYLIIRLEDNASNSISGAVITVNLNGAKNYTTDGNGIIKVPTNALAVNNYVAKVSFGGDENYFASNAAVDVKINKDVSKFAASAVSTIYNVAKKLVVTLKDSKNRVMANKNVAVKVGTISKTLKTNIKGQVSVEVSSLAAKAYTATIKFAGDANYKAASTSVKVTVKKDNTKLVASGKSFTVKATKKVTAVLKDSKNHIIKNRYVTFKVAGKTYKVKTDSKGVATATVKIAKKGSFGTAISFAGDNCYNKCSKSIKVIVK